LRYLVRDEPSGGCTAWELIFERAHQAPEAVAIAAPGRNPLCFGDLESHITAVSGALNAMGVGRNDRVALVLPNGPEMAVAFLALASCATCAPLNPAYTASEFGFYVDDLQARALIVQAGSDSPARVAARRRGIPIIELTLNPNAAAGSFTVSDAGTSCTQATPDLARADDIALVLHTSGTTARPKQVPLTHDNLCASARHIATTLQLSADDRCLNILPLFHIHGLVAAVLAPLAAGGSVACTPGLAGGRFFDWLEALRPTWYTGVPTMHQSILAGANAFRDAIRRNPLRFIRSSSAPLPPLVMVALERCFSAPVIEAYGMTEAAHQIASNPLPPGLRKPGSVGLAAGADVAITNAADELLPCGERGEIVIRGPNVAAGYHAASQVNHSARTRSWFHTGDQGWLDADGYLYITGRLQEMINRGGEKISPLEIDAAIESHPAILAAATFGIFHRTLGEEIVAAVVKEGDAAIRESEIVDQVRQRMGPTRVPRQIYFVDQLPRTESGKLRRSDLPRLLGLDQPRVTSARSLRVEGPGSTASPLEAALVGLWMSVLQVTNVGPDDDFFLLGGDSLLGARLLTSVNSVFGVDLAIHALFAEAATVAGMARAIEAARSK
jgi:acyl-CoA synthetase (AMP-forming)/AMP-acid ligase II